MLFVITSQSSRQGVLSLILIRDSLLLKYTSCIRGAKSTNVHDMGIVVSLV